MSKKIKFGEGVIMEAPEHLKDTNYTTGTFYPEDTCTNSDKLDALEKKMDENFEKIIDMLVDMNEKLLDMLERRWE